MPNNKTSYNFGPNGPRVRQHLMQFEVSAGVSPARFHELLCTLIHERNVAASALLCGHVANIATVSTTPQLYIQSNYGEHRLRPFDLHAANLDDAATRADLLGVALDISANLSRAARKLLNDKRPDAYPYVRFQLVTK